MTRRADARSKIVEALAEEGISSMWEIKKRKGLFYSTVHKAVKTLQEQGSVRLINRAKSQKGVETIFFGLTFFGFVRYLASQANLMAPAEFEEVNKGVIRIREKNIKDKKARERLLRLSRIVRRQGDLLNYPIFMESHGLAQHFGLGVYQDFLDAAKALCANFPVPYWRFIVQGDEWLEKRVQGINEMAEEGWRCDFAERFFERIIHISDRKMPSKILREFAEEVLRKKKEREITVLERATELFGIV